MRVHLKMETVTGNMPLLNIATDTQHQVIYSLYVQCSSLNSGSSFRCTQSPSRVML